MPAKTQPSAQGYTSQAAVALALLLGIVIFTPLFRAGATPLAALVSQVLAAGLLATVLWSPQRLTISGAQALVLLLFALLPALYVIPLPADIAEMLPGRGLYGEATAHLPPPSDPAPATLALDSGAAAGAALALLLPISVFSGVRVLKPGQIEMLIGLVIAIAVLQALLGLAQYGIEQAGGTPLKVAGSHGNAAVGTYANRNHLAGLLEMALPMTLALLFYAMSRLKGDAEGSGFARRGAASLGSRPGHAVIFYGAIALLLIVGVVFTRSRTGIALTILGILLSAVLFSRQIGRRGALGPAGVILMLGLAAGVSIGLAPVLERFSVSGLEDDARWQIFHHTLRGAGELFPVGAGPGAFPAVFPAYQPLELGRVFINRAHNDYLEWFFNLGAAAIVLVVLVIAVYLLQWGRVLAAGQGARSSYLQVGAGLSVLLLGLHELVDYNLFMPANQVVFALLLSVFLYPPQRLADTARRPQRRAREVPDLAAEPRPGPVSTAPPPDQIENPFLSAADR